VNALLVQRTGNPLLPAWYTSAVVLAAARGGYLTGMSQAIPARVLDLEALAAEVADFLDEAPVAETMAAKLSRVLHGFLEGDVLPQAERAADLGLDPTPLLAVVFELLRLYADALRLPNPTGL
jgi:hypothetical protein